MHRLRTLLIGGGGHCKVILSQLKKLNNFEIAGVVENHIPIGNIVNGVRVIGTDEDLKNLLVNGIPNALITVGSSGDNARRESLFFLAEQAGFGFPLLISPGALVDETAVIGQGTVILPGSIINAESQIGRNCIINSGAIVEHDCIIGDHCHIAPGASISGGVKIGCRTFIGLGSSVIQGITIGENVLLGAGSVVIRDIPDNVVAVGNPARVIKPR